MTEKEILITISYFSSSLEIVKQISLIFNMTYRKKYETIQNKKYNLPKLV